MFYLWHTGLGTLGMVGGGERGRGHVHILGKNGFLTNPKIVSFTTRQPKKVVTYITI